MTKGSMFFRGILSLHGNALKLDYQVLCDMDSGKEFLLCEYNRDADSYR